MEEITGLRFVKLLVPTFTLIGEIPSKLISYSNSPLVEVHCLVAGNNGNGLPELLLMYLSLELEVDLFDIPHPAIKIAPKININFMYKF